MLLLVAFFFHHVCAHNDTQATWDCAKNIVFLSSGFVLTLHEEGHQDLGCARGDLCSKGSIASDLERIKNKFDNVSTLTFARLHMFAVLKCFSI